MNFPIFTNTREAHEQGIAVGVDKAKEDIIAYLQRKRLNYSAQRKFIDGIIRYIERLKVI
jgi:hypothetical protein